MSGNQPAMQKYGLGAGIALCIVAVAALAFQITGGRESGLAPVSKTAFYTNDSGKTFFKDKVDKLPPFDHQGKQALRCDVFEASGGAQFVGLLYRFTESGKREMAEYVPSKDSDGTTRREIEARGLQVKPVAAPDKAWEVGDEVTVTRLRDAVKDPAGKPAKLVQP